MLVDSASHSEHEDYGDECTELDTRCNRDLPTGREIVSLYLRYVVIRNLSRDAASIRNDDRVVAKRGASANEASGGVLLSR